MWNVNRKKKVYNDSNMPPRLVRCNLDFGVHTPPREGRWAENITFSEYAIEWRGVVLPDVITTPDSEEFVRRARGNVTLCLSTCVTCHDDTRPVTSIDVSKRSIWL